ncbi:MAG TPA: haloacid dehalogenase type II [Nocardioidaceae bacterium]|nr:haloacid dehalogenase type II [Nocardioidaceae bacterium]
MSGPSVVVFDVNETLSDLRPLARRFEGVGAPASLATLWFASVLREGFALTAAGASARFADIGREMLLDLLPDSVEDRAAAVEHVLGGFMDLDVHPDVVPGVRALRDAGLRLVTMSNGASAVAERLLDRAGVRDEFEQLLSVEDAGVWKPAADAYRFVAERCSVGVEQLVMVAVHPWDTDGAARAGLRTAWVDRDGRHYPQYATPPTWTVPSVEALATVLA